MRAAAGRRLGPCLLQEEIGRGGSSIVFRAQHALLQRDVAVKVIAGALGSLVSDETFLARFRQEAQLVARLSHPHILPILESGQTGPEDDVPEAAYLVGEYLSGGNLATHLEREGASLDVRERCVLAVAVAEQIGAALDHAHSHDVLHRDLKPSNILLDGSGRYVLSDFGMARLLQNGASLHLTATGLVAGTPAYMAPEQALGEPAETCTDLYGLAVVLYEIVVGRVPFDAETPLATMLAHVHQPPPSPRRVSPDVPRAVEVVLLHSLAKGRDDRYGSGYELSRALHAAVGAAFGKHLLDRSPSMVRPLLELPARRARVGREERARLPGIAARRPRRGRAGRFFRFLALGTGATALLASLGIGSAAMLLGPGRFRLAGFAERFISNTLGPAWTEAAPRDGARDEPVLTRIVVRFSHEMDQPSVQAAFAIEPAVPIRFEWNGKLLTAQPEAELSQSTAYVISIDHRRALDVDGRPLTASLHRRFTTGAQPAPAVQLAPAPPAVGLGNLPPFSLFQAQPTPLPTTALTSEVRPAVPAASPRIEPIVPAPTYAPPTVFPQPPDTSIVAGLVVTAEQVDEEMAAPFTPPIVPAPQPSTTPNGASLNVTPVAPPSVTPTSVSRPQSTPSPAESTPVSVIATGTMSVFATATPARATASSVTPSIGAGGTPASSPAAPTSTLGPAPPSPTAQATRPAVSPTPTAAPSVTPAAPLSGPT